MGTAFRVAIIGDSVMEGQGLLDKDKFTNKASREIGNLLGRSSVDIVVNTARSGAPIEATTSNFNARQMREKFVDTYPSLFKTQKLRTDFIDKNIQEPAFLLTPELPATFPTIMYQVNRMGRLFPKSTRLGVELVILDGGANDLDFQAFLKAEKHQHNYIEFYEPRFEKYFHQRTKKLITRARQLFPNAVIVYTGLYTPFLPNVSHGDVKELFEHESGEPVWKVLFNNYIIGIVDVDQLVDEAQYRSLHGLTRGLYWMRRTIAEINEDHQLRGPGVIFIHPQFKPENTVFAKNSLIHKEYKEGKIADKVFHVRANTCPRNEFREAMDDLMFLLLDHLIHQSTNQSGGIVLDLRVRLMLKAFMKYLDGPTSMLEAFQNLLDTPNYQTLAAAISLLGGDLGRIYDALRASFLHPNEKGAQRYANVIVKRYKERLHEIHFLEDVRKLQTTSNSTKQIKMKSTMARYGFRGNLSLRTITQNMLVDSIRLDVTTAPDSVKDFIDELILDMGGKNRWILTLPVRLLKNVDKVTTIIAPIEPQLKPHTTDIFTIDASSIHLGSLKRLVIERRVNKILSTDAGRKRFSKDLGSGAWKPTHISLQINGVKVFDKQLSGSLRRGGKLVFPYPSQ